MAKPRRKVIRKVGAPKKEVNPEIQKVLERQAEKRRIASQQRAGTDEEYTYDERSDEERDSDGSEEKENGATKKKGASSNHCGNPCAPDPMRMCSSPLCPWYSVAADKDFETPPNTVLVRAIDVNSRCLEPRKDFLYGFDPYEALRAPMEPSSWFRLTDYHYLVEFTKEDYDRVIELGTLWSVDHKSHFKTQILIPPVRLMTDLLEMLAYNGDYEEQDNEGDDYELDPPVDGGLIPLLRRSDYSHPVKLDSFSLTPNAKDEKMLAILSS